MSNHRASRFSTSQKWVLTILSLMAILVVASAVFVRRSYTENLRPLSSSNDSIVVTIEPGSPAAVIADTLMSKKVIRSDWAFEWYVRNHNLRDQLKAGTYLLRPSQSISEIVNTLIEGRVATDLVRILPEQRLDQIRAGLIEAGYTAEEVDAALEPTQYDGHLALSDKPRGASLEGYLYPETFQKTSETTVKQIIALSLDEMQTRLTPEIRQAIARNGLSLQQGITLASLVEREVAKPEDRVVVAQVFYKRLKQGMNLESNATDDYAKLNPAYDTYKINGLPPGPISNVGENALQAVAFPAQTDWLYFVSGDGEHQGKTYFSKTLEEHQDLTRKYCSKCL